MPMIKLSNVNVYYEIHGTGQPLVLVAGYTCDHEFWLLMHKKLAQHFQVVLFDNRAVGQTKDPDAVFTLETMAEDTVALVDKLDLKRPHILGQSMGGAIAQHIARNYPDKIGKLIIADSTAQFNTRTLLVTESLLKLRQENVPLDTLIETCMPWFFSIDFLAVEGNVALIKELTKNKRYPQSIDDQERQFKALRAFNARPWLHEIKNPTLIMAAAEDIITLPSESQQLASAITNSQFITLSGGHSSPIEKPDEMSTAIIKFLTA